MPLQVFCRNCAQYRREWCNLKVDSPDPDLVRDCQYYRGKTNADRIRSMTDEELAEWLADKVANHGGGSCAPGCYDCSIHPEGCVRPWLDWLKQEADG